MILGQVFPSINAWKKLAAINMKPKIAFAILRYSKLIVAEYQLIEDKRTSLIYEITGADKGTNTKIEPGTPELEKYVQEFNEILGLQSDLRPINMNFAEVIEAVDEKEESLSVQDLALLEPFFKDYVEPAAEKTDTSPCCEVCDPGPNGCGKDE